MKKLTLSKKAPAASQATHAKMVNRLENWLAQSSPQEYIDGCCWYAEAGGFCSVVADECGYTEQQVAQAVAILSPQTDWDQNKRNAVLIATTRNPWVKIFATLEQKARALQALCGEYQLEPSARKTYSFAENISNPASLRVTVDRHATKAALYDLTAAPVSLTPLQYGRIEAAYQQVAKKHGLLPYQLQAIIWVTYKRVVGR